MYVKYFPSKKPAPAPRPAWQAPPVPPRSTLALVPPTPTPPPAPAGGDAIFPWNKETPLEKGARFRGISVEEYARRDKIICNLALNCPYNKGDVVYPATKEDYEQYGSLRVIGVSRNYADLGKDWVWTEHVPINILTVFQLDGNKQVMFVHPSWLSKVKPEESVC